MTLEEKGDMSSSKAKEFPKSDIKNIHINDEDDEDDDDYVPTLMEKQEAEKEITHLHSLKEDDNKDEKRTLDEETIKEIDNLWEQMKTEPTNSGSPRTKEINSVKTIDSKNDFVNNANSYNEKNSTSKIVPQKRKRVSTMDDIIKRHSTSKRESTLDKSKRMWQIYRQEKNIGDDLDIQSKNSHIERSSFLNQAKYNEWKRSQEYRLKDILKKQNKP